MLLYIGLGLAGVGLMVTVVGLGDRGYYSLELQLVGPCFLLGGISITGISVICCCCSSQEERFEAAENQAQLSEENMKVFSKKTVGTQVVFVDSNFVYNDTIV